MATIVEVRLAPAEFKSPSGQSFVGTTCVVFDILRATSVFVTALANGARTIRPVAEIADALTARRDDPSVMLAGERQGLRLRAADTGGTDFDFGNSPREFTPERVAGRRIVSTTTNGTRALRACAAAERIFAASFLNLQATAQHLANLSPKRVILICAGTGEALALEDVLAAGAMLGALSTAGMHMELTDSAQVALGVFQENSNRIAETISSSVNGKRLMRLEDLREDVAFCSQINTTPIIVEQNADGELERR